MDVQTLKVIINLLKQKSLSGREILKLVAGKASLHAYPELAKFKTLDQVLGRHKASVILYETERGYGHWVGLLKSDPCHVEFFDPYGMMPDDELKWIPIHFRKANNEMIPHLSYLILNSGCTIEYNHDKLQQLKDHVNTCGRWVATRINYRKLILKDFVKLMKMSKNYTPDEIVTLITGII